MNIHNLSSCQCQRLLQSAHLGSHAHTEVKRHCAWEVRWVLTESWSVLKVPRRYAVTWPSLWNSGVVDIFLSFLRKGFEQDTQHAMPLDKMLILEYFCIKITFTTSSFPHGYSTPYSFKKIFTCIDGACAHKVCNGIDMRYQYSYPQSGRCHSLMHIRYDKKSTHTLYPGVTTKTVVGNTVYKGLQLETTKFLVVHVWVLKFFDLNTGTKYFMFSTYLRR
jgi:hypothetical protein